MAEVSAQAVAQLRDKTGVGMMDCKKALSACAGDVRAAIKHLREKGLAKAAQKAGREASQGTVAAWTSSEGAALVEVNCETDFVARNEQFQAFAQRLSACVGQANVPATVVHQGDAVSAAAFGGGGDVRQQVHDLITRIGENIVVRRLAKLNGGNAYGSYLHHGGTVGAVVQLTLSDAGKAADPVVRQVAKDLCMHIAACEPRAVSRENLDAATVNSEREVLRKRVLDEGKPEQIVDRIVTGKLNKFFSQNCLLEQPFVKDNTVTVSQYIQQQAKQSGCDMTVDHFVCFRVGGDFAS
ncbi:MAG: translation elongation factor Ts [Myxococcota bacterium]